MLPCCQWGKLEQVKQQLFYEDRLGDFADDRREADGSELPWVCYAVFLRLGLLFARRKSSGA